MNKNFFLVYLFILLVSFCCSIINLRKLPGTLKLFPVLLGVTFIIESTAFYLLFYTLRDMYVLYHLYVPFSYMLLAFVYSNFIVANWKRKLIKLSIPAFLIFHLYLTLFIQQIDSVNSYATMVAAILLVSLALLYYYDLLKDERSGRWIRKPLFWISTGNLIFYTGIFFLMGFSNYLVKEAPALGKKLMFISYSLNFILYTLYSIGFLCTTQNRKSLL